MSSSAKPLIRRFSLTNVHCAGCAARVEKLSGQVPGVSSVKVDLAALTLTAEGSGFDVNAVMKAVKSGGYGITLLEDFSSRREKILEHPENWNSVIWLSCVWLAAVPVYLSGNVLPEICALTGIVLLLVLMSKVLYRGMVNLILLRPDMDTLIALGGLGALLYTVLSRIVPGMTFHNHLHTAAMIWSFSALGRFIEARCRRRTTEFLREFWQLVPETAHRITENKEIEEIPAGIIQAGNRLLVKTGERIPADGVVLSGEGEVVELEFTGEVVPVFKQTGSQITGGTEVVSGSFEFLVSAAGEQSRLGMVINLVEKAQSSKLPIGKTADRIAGCFTWGVLSIAFLTCLVHLLLGHGSAMVFERTLAVLSAACPCAFGLAAPLALVCGVGMAAKCGILIRDAAVFEELNRARTWLWDKTGTLTSGELQFDGFHSVFGEKPEELLGLLAALEGDSVHPAATALRKLAAEKNSAIPSGAVSRQIPGSGVEAEYENRKYFLGSISGAQMRLAAGNTIPDEILKQESGKLKLVCLKNGAYYCSLVLKDALRPEAKDVIKELRELIPQLKTALLSGDTEQSAAAVAGALGIEEAHGALTPEAKEEFVRQTNRETPCVMVGDGINDTPALAAAQAGIAVGGGTPAEGSAGISLRRGDLRRLPELVKLSRKIIRTIKLNFLWAGCYNVIMLPWAAGLFRHAIAPGWAAAGMAASSLLVVLNSLLILKSEKHGK